MIFGLEPRSPLPENWTPLEATAVIKCLDEEGTPALVVSVTESLTDWEQLGMLSAAVAGIERDLVADLEDEP